jgi:hypothetical protein
VELSTPLKYLHGVNRDDFTSLQREKTDGRRENLSKERRIRKNLLERLMFY